MASKHSILIACVFLNQCLMIQYTTGNQQCTASIGGTCPPTWSQWGDKCYKVTEPLTWFKAREECVKMGGVMAAPHSMAENEHLLRIKQGGNVWINCNDLQTTGVWECKEKTVEVHFRDWAGGQPSGRNSDGEEHCAAARQGGKGWNDLPCYWELSAVCKKPVSPMLHF